MTLLASLRAVGLNRRIARDGAVYDRPPADLAAYQLDRLNTAWGESLARSPWARRMQVRLDLPDRLGSWDEFSTRIPIQAKADVVDDLVIGEPPPPVRWLTTGGSTAEPFRFPSFASEVNDIVLPMWLGRARLGVRPQFRAFLIWGHNHALGAGFAGWKAQTRRQVLDRLLGYRRISAYALEPEKLQAAAEQLLVSRARYVVGYSTALDRFARANLHRAGAIAAMKLKVVIATADGFPRTDSRDVIEACFGCPVAMEYGSTETGPVAYEQPGKPFHVFWSNYLLELTGPPGADGARALVVTTLTPRAFPLLRYSLGDLVRPLAGEPDIRQAFGSVTGRANDFVALKDGQVVHSMAFMHCIRDEQAVRAYQIVRDPGGLVSKVRYEAAGPLDDATAGRIRARLRKVNPSLGDLTLERVETLSLTRAGKHQMVVEADS